MTPQLTRDVIQARLLSELFTNITRHELVLKGGMAMLALGGTRATKDIDLASNPRVSPASLRKRVRSAIKVVRASGLLEKVVVSEPKQTDTVCRWKINGRLPEGGSAIHLTLEVSRRGIPVERHIARTVFTPPAAAGLAPFELESYDPTAMAAAKTTALLDARRTSPRDLYDLSILIDMEIEPPIHLLQNLGRDHLKTSLQTLWQKLDLMDWDLFRGEVLPYVGDAERAALDEQRYETLRLRVGETVERWIQGAIDSLPSGDAPARGAENGHPRPAGNIS